MNAKISLLCLVVFLALALPAQASQKHETKSKKRKHATEQTEGARHHHPCYSPTHGHKGRCEPQSLPYGRCRSQIWSCQGNIELSPIGWWECESRRGHGSAVPLDGSICILGDNSKHRMRTGHVFYVEKATHHGGPHYSLVLSHTNYDRRCSLETDVHADYDAHAKTLTMRTGHWSAWGKNLHVSGFIVR